MILQALISKQRGIAHAWEMAAASYQHSRGYGLSVWGSVAGALWVFRKYMAGGDA